MEKEQKGHFLFKIFAILIIIFLILYLYGRYLEPTFFKIYEIPIYNSNFPKIYNGFKIAHFTDLHYGRTTDEETLKKVIKELNDLNADIVVFTGDLFDSKPSSKEIKLLTTYLSKINTKLEKFAVIGDYDSKYLSDYATILQNSNFILLDNTSEYIYNESSIPLNFIGFTNKNYNSELISSDYFNIALFHEPDLIKELNNINLALAGHSLGGQIKMPFYGGLRKIKGASTYLDSYYKIKNTDLYISNGIGTQDFSLRLFNTPSVTLYRIYNS